MFISTILVDLWGSMAWLIFDNQIPAREARLMPGLNWCISQSSPTGGVRMSCYGR